MLGEHPISTQKDHRGRCRSKRRVKPLIAANYVLRSVLFVRYFDFYLDILFYNWQGRLSGPSKEQETRMRSD